MTAENRDSAGGDERYAGLLHVEHGETCTTLLQPERYAAANQLVVRQRSVTQNWQSGNPGWTIWDREANECDDATAQNPDLAPDEVRLKRYGEDAELFRVSDSDAEPEVDRA